MPNEKELLEILLTNRGIKKEDWDKFLDPSYEDHLYDPFLMPDMGKACVRIFEAIEAKEKIIIYADYDCDGIPAAVIMNDFFQKIKFVNYSIYIPDRHDEGYGLHHEAIEQFIKDEVKLLITFDLGITAILEVANATANGIDVIITDHHLPRLISDKAGLPRRSLEEDVLIREVLPQAYAILNPKIGNYPDKMLCGAGVAFKLIQALIIKYGEYFKINNGWEKWLLDLVGIATLADQVPLLEENRVLAFYGLKVLKKGRRLGLVELFNQNGTNIRNLNEEDITFTLAPRLNAASRMANPIEAFNLLATKDLSQAKTLAIYLSKINNDRKLMVAQIMKEIKKNLKKREEKEIIVIGNPKWRIGVLGIVASKVVEEYQKPAFIWGGDGNNCLRGSCRTYNDINLSEIMNLLPPGSLLEFGGHEGAGGFSVSHEEVHFLEERLLISLENIKLNKSDKKEINNYLGEPNQNLNVDAYISINDVTEANYHIIEKLAPFGQANPKPTFLIRDIGISAIREFGKENNHLELIFINEKGIKIKAIAFFKNRQSFMSPLSAGQRINIIVSLERNTFMGKNELRLRIIDIVL